VKRLTALTVILAWAATPALAGERPRQRSFANPSTIAAAEYAFNRLAREKGQWTAFRETAADDAVMFVPEKVLAKDWLKKRPDPAQPVQWEPQRIYISCDRRTAASTGAWQRPDGSTGYFTTLWQLDDKGEWKWVLDHGDVLATPLPETEFLEGHVATCIRGGRSNDPDGEERLQDQSLLWSYTVQDDGSRRVTVRVWNGGSYDTVINDRVSAKP